MSSLYEAYAADKSAVEDGKWIEVQPGVMFKVRSESSIKVREWALKRAKSQRQLIVAGGGVISPHLSDKNEIDQCVQCTVVDWKGVTDQDGKELPYSKEACQVLMSELANLRRDIMFLARTDETFRPEATTAELGKISPAPTAPISASAAEHSN